MTDSFHNFGGQGNAGVPISRSLDGKVVPHKTGLIIAKDGMERLQKRLSFGEFRGKKRRDWRKEGFGVTKEEDAGHGADSLRGTRIWYLTDEDATGKPLQNFCIDCGRTDIVVRLFDGKPLSRSSPGVTMIPDDRPDLDLRPGDVVAYWVCAGCCETQLREQEGPPGVLVDAHGERYVDQLADQRAERMKTHAYQWIKNAKLRGKQYRVYQGV